MSKATMKVFFAGSAFAALAETGGLKLRRASEASARLLRGAGAVNPLGQGSPARPPASSDGGGGSGSGPALELDSVSVQAHPGSPQSLPASPAPGVDGDVSTSAAEGGSFVTVKFRKQGFSGSWANAVAFVVRNPAAPDSMSRDVKRFGDAAGNLCGEGETITGVSWIVDPTDFPDETDCTPGCTRKYAEVECSPKRSQEAIVADWIDYGGSLKVKYRKVGSDSWDREFHVHPHATEKSVLHELKHWAYATSLCSRGESIIATDPTRLINWIPNADQEDVELTDSGYLTMTQLLMHRGGLMSAGSQESRKVTLYAEVYCVDMVGPGGTARDSWFDGRVLR